MKIKFIFFFKLLFVLTSCYGTEPITSCEPIGKARPLCGWQNPEDMVALPDGNFVIVSEYGDPYGEKAGTLSLLNLKTEEKKTLFQGLSASPSEPWGDAKCSTPPGEKFSPHGIHLSQRVDGKLQLLAVQHGGRESIEVFEVHNEIDDWRLTWKGCVVAPTESMLNDVVSLPEGGFLATHMMPRKDSFLAKMYEFIKIAALGVESGYVLQWSQQVGFKELPNTRGKMPNGIEISPDGKSIFVNYSLNNEIRKINRLNGQIEAQNFSLPSLDNSTWSLDGKILAAATLASSMELMNCEKITSGNCSTAFAIFSIDPTTLHGEIIYKGGPGTPSGAATVGLELKDGSLLVGTFAGDRIVRIIK